jgi:hypothetical protein
MGGWGSGRQYGAPVAEECLRVDLPWMLRNGRAVPGLHRGGTLSWNCGGEPSGSISYQANLIDPDNASLILTYKRGTGSEAEEVRQEILLTCTKPNYGGRRWWMICPYRGHRVSILYKPGNGDRFASRKAWRVQYKSQRIANRDKPFEALYRIQKRLGCQEGWELPIRRPKGMWHRTYAKLEDRFYQLNDECTLHMMAMVGLLKGRVQRTKKRG